MADEAYVSLHGFYVRAVNISRRTVMLKPFRVPGGEIGLVPFSAFEGPSLVRTVNAARTRSQVNELRIKRSKAEELGWVKPAKEKSE